MFQTLARRTVLCIGGDESGRDFLCKSLRDYELVFTRTAFEAIRSMNSRVFDGYLTDFWLADWSGVQLCREVRKGDPHCAVVVYTVASGEAKVQRARRAGADAFVSIDEAHLLKGTLRTLLSRADTKSLQAKPCMEEAAFAEFARCAGHGGEEAGSAVAPSFIEAKARKCAYASFIEAGGTRSHFERWWPQVFASTRARYTSERS